MKLVVTMKELKWDYSAEPTWIDGVNTPIKDIVKDKEKIKEIEDWYREFSKAEVTLHANISNDDEPITKYISEKDLEKIIIDMRDRLIPLGKKLAKGIGAELVVDWGHDEIIKKLTFKFFGKNNKEINNYWKRQDNIKKAVSQISR